MNACRGVVAAGTTGVAHDIFRLAAPTGFQPANLRPVTPEVAVFTFLPERQTCGLFRD